MTLFSAMFALALASEAPTASETAPSSAARGAVMAFLESDFRGAKLREDLVWMKGIERLFEPTWDPIVAVAAPCDVEAMSERNGKATAAIVCRRLAVRTSAGGDYKQDRRDDRFRVRAERRAGRWAVVNPPIARVSVDVLLEMHRLDAAPTETDAWKKGASKEQREGLGRIQRARR